ncbi:hypothetical protein HJD18_04385 [Thermoleophilia bacterium SCSIO 60948]|nr:hypothetical protein HJD18_04385 [Thermoleophilia bacterium SCSIO 60948]
MPAVGRLEIEVRPPWPYRLPSHGGGDGVLRISPTTVGRLMHVGDTAILVLAWQCRDGRVGLRASGEASREQLELAIERMRFAICVDDDLSDFKAAFGSHPLIRPALASRPWKRPKRRVWPWEALAWAITEQLIESTRAAAIQRRIVGRYGRFMSEGQTRSRLAERPSPEAFVSGRVDRRFRDGSARGSRDPARRSRRRASRGPWTYSDVPCPTTVSGLSPAELVSLDLSAARSLAMIKCAKEVATGRADPGDPAFDARFLRISEIGPWTLQCLGMFGRGEPDSLPAGDLAYVKLVGHLAGLGRRATVAEVDEFFAPFAPYRGLAGMFMLSSAARSLSEAGPLPLAPDALAA